MATLNEIAYNILNIARSGRSSDDDTLSINQIKHWIHYYRGTLLQKYTSNGRKIHPNCLQILIAPVVEAECDQGRIDQVPDVMSFAGQRAIERIETCNPNGWEFPSEELKSAAEEIILYVFYDMTSLDLPTIKNTYNGVVDWINQQKFYLDNPSLGIEGHKVKVAYHTACTSERWLDWGTVPMTGRFNNACDSGGAGTGRCGGRNTKLSSGYITQTGTESGNGGGYQNVAATTYSGGTVIDCSQQKTHTGGGIADATEHDWHGYGKVLQVQDWVQNSNDISLNDPNSTNPNRPYNPPPKKATYYDGTTSFEISSGNSERVVSGSFDSAGYVRVHENINGVWNLVGQPLFGSAGDYFGRSVDINPYGNYIAVGCPQIDGGAGETGFVRVYEYNVLTYTWDQLGGDIPGQVDGDQFGDSVSLGIGADTARVAISAPGHDSSIGTVQVWQFDRDFTSTTYNTWVQLGADIDGDSTYDKAGGAGYNNTIHLSGWCTGQYSCSDTLAIGYPDSPNGTVRIYQWNGNTWAQTGPDLNGESSGDQFGFTLALNHGATRIVIGAPGNAGGGTDRGEVYVYELQSGVWVQLGSDLPGGTDSGEFGCSVDIDSVGKKIIVGAKKTRGGGTAGHARVYFWSVFTNDWVQLGGDIDGEDSGDEGFSVSINGTGDIIAVGSPLNDDSGTNGGSTKTYAFFCGQWRLIGSEINGAPGSQEGWNVSLSDKSERDTVVFYDTEPGTYAVDFATHTLPTLTDHAQSWGTWKIDNSSTNNRRLGTSAQGFGPPPVCKPDDNVVVLIFADEASDADGDDASDAGGPYHTNFRPDGDVNLYSTLFEEPSASNPTGTPVIMDSSNPSTTFTTADAGGTTITAPTYISQTANVWRFATDNGNSQTGSEDIASYTSKNTALTGYFNNVTINDVHPSPCWKADWIHHVEKRSIHNGLYLSYLYPTRQTNVPNNQLQYNVPFALHAAGAISSGDQVDKDGTFAHDGTTGNVPYCQVTDLSPLYYINPYYTTGFGALDQFGWSLNYEMGVFNAEKLQDDLNALLETITWTEVVIPDNSAVDLCDCYEHIPTNIDRLRFQQFNRFTPGRAINGRNIFRWYIEPQGFRYHDKISIILPDWNPNLGLAKIWAVFSNPEDILGYEADFEYPFPDELISPLMLEVLQKELNMTLSTSTDQLNDSRGVAPTPKAKTKKK